jgi:UDP-N-acetyl-D-mannosaminuronate dehydrogenase
MTAREIQAKNLALELVKHAKETNLKIYIHGKAYKPNVEYLDGSYSILVGHFCQQLGYEVEYIDPLTESINAESVKGVVLLAHSASTTYKYSSHLRQRDALYCNIEEGSVVVDPWRSYKNDKVKVVHYGNTRNV